MRGPAIRVSPSGRAAALIAAVAAAACLAASPAAAGVTSLDFASDAGDPIGGGQVLHLTPADGRFWIERRGINAITVYFMSPDLSQYWDLTFAAPGAQPLGAGLYEGAGRYPFQGAGVPGLDVNGNSNGCGVLSGDFQVKQVLYDAGGAVVAFRASFGQHCGGALPALNGEIRYNADVTVAVHAPSSVHGERGKPLAITVLAEDTAGDPLSIAAGSLPPGATFTDNGDGTGVLRWIPLAFGSFQAAFEARDPAGRADSGIAVITVVGSTALTLRGACGSPYHYCHYGPSDGSFGIARNWAGGISALFQNHARYLYWTFDFAGPDGTPLQPGVYEGATRFPFQGPSQPGMSAGGGCQSLTGRFEIDQVAYDPSGGVRSLRVFFDQACDGTVLSGEFRANADVPVVVTAPAEIQAEETRDMSFDVTALDVEGRPVTLQAESLPPGAAFVDRGSGQGTFTWTPDLGQSGSYVITIRAEDGAGGRDAASTLITVARHAPDLAVYWLEARVGCQGEVSTPPCFLRGLLGILNHGTAEAAGSRIRFYLSADRILDPGDATLKETATGPLPPSDWTDWTLREIAVRLPEGEVHGRYLITLIEGGAGPEDIDSSDNTAILGPLRPGDFVRGQK